MKAMGDDSCRLDLAGYGIHLQKKNEMKYLESTLSSFALFLPRVQRSEILTGTTHTQ